MGKGKGSVASFGQGKGKGPGKGRGSYADWVCSNCNYVNHSWRTKCNSCSQLYINNKNKEGSPPAGGATPAASLTALANAILKGGSTSKEAGDAVLAAADAAADKKPLSKEDRARRYAARQKMDCREWIKGSCPHGAECEFKHKEHLKGIGNAKYQELRKAAKGGGKGGKGREKE